MRDSVDLATGSWHQLSVVPQKPKKCVKYRKEDSETLQTLIFLYIIYYRSHLEVVYKVGRGALVFLETSDIW